MTPTQLKKKQIPIATFGTRYCEFDPIELKVKCPHCNADVAFELTSDDFSSGEMKAEIGKVVELECDKCNKEFEITIVATFSMRLEVKL